MNNINDKLKKCALKDVMSELHKKDPLKKWINLIPLDNCVFFEKYDKKEYFKKVADIELDEEMFEEGKNKGTKKRTTLIRSVLTIPERKFNEKFEWIYIFTMNKKIVKIGGTRTSLKERIGSYLCGHHVEGRGKSGKCSVTNAFIYNTFEFYLKNGYKIEMFGYKLPKTIIKISADIAFGEEIEEPVQTYHLLEGMCLKQFKKKYGEYPPLSKNSDPKMKD